MFHRIFITCAFLLAACQVDTPTAGTQPTAGSWRAGLGAGEQCRFEPEFEVSPMNACASAQRLRLAFVGDVLVHWQLQQLGYERGFRPIWSQAEGLMSRADLTVANLEGPVAPGLGPGGRQMRDPGPVYGTGVYSGYPAFNYHPMLAEALAQSGVDIVTTANNHAMDRGSRGADATLDQVAKAGLGAVGTIRAGATRDFVLRQRSKLGTLSLIACSFSTNGLADPHRQVLGCYSDRAELLSLVRREASDNTVAGVIVLPHWGTEYASAPNGNQRALARDLVAAGATAVVGTHPHAVQPWEALSHPDGAQVPVVYSTGNFIAVQTGLPARVGAMAVLDLCKAPGGKLVTHQGGWVAMQMEFTSRGYWLDVAPAGTDGARAVAQRHLARVAPGFSAQPICR